MKRASGFAAVVLVVIGCGTARAQTEGFEYNLNTGAFTELSVPGSILTYANGVSGQNVTGFYESIGPTGPITDAFVTDGFSYSTIAVPGALSTVAYGISSDGIVVGGAFLDGKEQAFFYDPTYKTPFTLYMPGVMSSYATGVAGNYVVGSYTTTSGSYAFRADYHGGPYSTIAPLGASFSEASAVTSSGDVVGAYTSNNISRGFFYDGTTYTTLGPQGSSFASATGISGNEVVGDYGIGGVEYGYLYDTISKTYTTLAVPGATNTTATGIDGENIIGTYLAGGLDHGYVYNSSTGIYTTIGVGKLQVLPLSISGSKVVGTYFAPLSVPEPSSIVLLGTAMAVTAAVVRMRRRSARPATP
ncbi:MAG: PEP-CTERM sorting domain-containing protein [Isosphaeraceae bacterium]